jgi:hypothetical protein
MLAKTSSESSDELRRLLQQLFFEAMCAQRRVIGDRQLDEAALALEAPTELAAIRERAVRRLWATYFQKEPPESAQAAVSHARAAMGQAVVVIAGRYAGQRGVVCSDDETSNPFRVALVDGTCTGWLRPEALLSSGLDEAAFLMRAMEMEDSVDEVRAACTAQLSPALADALADVRARIERDELPLLSLLQTTPHLELQCFHHSFQEYFAARALCDEHTRLAGAPPPWQWPAWWANTLTIGTQLPGFRRGLLTAAGVRPDEGGTLDLSGELGGDWPTVLRVLVQYAATLTRIDLRGNRIHGLDWADLFEALRVMDVPFSPLSAAEGIAKVARSWDAPCQISEWHLAGEGLDARATTKLAACTLLSGAPTLDQRGRAALMVARSCRAVDRHAR